MVEYFDQYCEMWWLDWNFIKSSKMGSEETTAELNEMAGKTPRKPSAKRSRVSDRDEDSPPSKESAITTLKSQKIDHGSTRRHRRRLRTDSSENAVEESQDQEDVTLSPTEQEKDIQRVPPIIPAASKRRQRAMNRAAPKPSPLKGHAFGTVDPHGDENAQLDDTPSARTRSKTKNLTWNPSNLRMSKFLPQIPPSAAERIRTPHKSLQNDHDQGAESENDNQSPKSARKGKQPGQAEIGEETMDDEQSGEEDSMQEDVAESVDEELEDGSTIEVRTPRSSTTAEAQTEEPEKSKGRETESAAETEQPKQAEPQNERSNTITGSDNSKETQTDEEKKLERLGKKYMSNIAKITKELHQTDEWFQMGGAALLIRRKAPKVSKLQSEKAQMMRQQMEDIASCYAKLDKQKEHTSQPSNKVLVRLQELRSFANLEFLRPNKSFENGSDQTVVELYEYLIPKTVHLLKEALLARYDKGFTYEHNKELLKLSKVGVDLCEIAAKWQPRPNKMVIGLKGSFRRYLRPNLERLYRFFKSNDFCIGQQLWEAKQIQKLSAKQSESQNLAIRRPRPVYTKRILQPSQGWQDNIVDVDVIQTEKQTDDRPRIQRQTTEEIPAPNPFIQWTEVENVALLNGLQMYRGTNRYSLILERNPQLNGKDLDQVLAQAQFFKKTARQKIEEQEKKGDHSLKWLSSVEL